MAPSEPRPSGDAHVDPTSQSLPPSASTEPECARAFDLLQRVKSGELSGDDLQPDSRRVLVAMLSGEGASIHEIARVLKVSDRTVERDRKANAQRNAVTRDPALTGIILGRQVTETEQDIQLLKRMARDKDIDPAVRVQAIAQRFAIFDRLIQCLQSTGHMDRVPQELRADLTHRAVTAVPDPEALAQELERIKTIHPTSPGIAAVEAMMLRAQAATSIKELTVAKDGTEVIHHEDRP